MTTIQTICDHSSAFTYDDSACLFRRYRSEKTNFEKPISARTSIMGLLFSRRQRLPSSNQEQKSAAAEAVESRRIFSGVSFGQSGDTLTACGPAAPQRIKDGHKNRNSSSSSSRNKRENA